MAEGHSAWNGSELKGQRRRFKYMWGCEKFVVMMQEVMEMYNAGVFLIQGQSDSGATRTGWLPSNRRNTKGRQTQILLE